MTLSCLRQRAHSTTFINNNPIPSTRECKKERTLRALSGLSSQPSICGDTGLLEVLHTLKKSDAAHTQTSDVAILIYHRPLLLSMCQRIIKSQTTGMCHVVVETYNIRQESKFIQPPMLTRQASKMTLLGIMRTNEL